MERSWSITCCGCFARRGRTRRRGWRLETKRRIKLKRELRATPKPAPVAVRVEEPGRRPTLVLIPGGVAANLRWHAGRGSLQDKRF
jgi:hypothetical protein